MKDKLLISSNTALWLHIFCLKSYTTLCIVMLMLVWAVLIYAAETTQEEYNELYEDFENWKNENKDSE